MNNLSRLARISFITLVIIFLCSTFTSAQYPISSYNFSNTGTSYFYPQSFPQIGFSTSTPYSSLGTSYYTPNATNIFQSTPTSTFYFPTTSPTSLYSSNSTFSQAPTASIAQASSFTPLATSFYQAPTTTLANTTGSYSLSPIAAANPATNSSIGYYNFPSIINAPYSPLSTNYYTPQTIQTGPINPAPVVNTLPPSNPYNPLPPANPYIASGNYSAAAGIVIDIDGDYVGEWESTLTGEDNDIKKCEIDQDGIFVDGSMKLKEFTTNGEAEFVGEINGNVLTLDVTLIEGSLIAIFIGEILVDSDGDITIVGTYTIMSQFNGAMIDQGIFELEED